MKKSRRSGIAQFATKLMFAALLMSSLALGLVSCGEEASQHSEGESEAKYPPGTTEEMLVETTGTGDGDLELDEPAGEQEESGSREPAPVPEASGELAGARFTVIAATRPDSNAGVLTSGQREVSGDYLEVELVIENTGDDLVDLSQFSFRIWSPGIDADQYEDYYGRNGTFGEYVDANIISAALLDYATLQPAAYMLKMGETVDGVFLFYDLNPKSTAENEGVTKEGTNLIVHKLRGDDAGEEVEINLSGFED